jgi:hypothetical protein
MRQNVISEIILSSDGETTAFNEAVGSNAIMRNGDVTTEMVGGKETFLAEMTHVISLTEMNFLRRKLN